MNNQLLQVEVRSRQGLMFIGELKAVTAFNARGQFDVLVSHANFVSMIRNKVILRRADGRYDEINVENGVMVVEENNVKIYLGISRA
jgi:F0F1-type ATP synthase epsilon subunit